jgi:hypothetical protein
VPGAPGVALPKPHLVGIREEMNWRPRDDDEPTNPYPRDPRQSGLIATDLPLTNVPASSRHTNRLSDRPPPSLPSDRPPPSLPASSGPASSRAVVHNGPPSSGRGPDSSSSLTVPNLTRVDAAQLAGIIAAWESADDGGRTLLAEFAKRLGRTPQK